MPRRELQSTLGDWFFQAQVQSSKLQKHTTNELTAHENKPRGRRQHETGVRPTDWAAGGADIAHENSIDDQMTILTGVRTIHGAQGGVAPPGGFVGFGVGLNWFDFQPIVWVGDPAVLYPTGPGLPPFKDNPVVTATYAGFGIADVPGPSIASWQDGDFFVDGVPFTSNDFWGRVFVSAPLNTDHRGRPGVTSMKNGVQFNIVHGFLNDEDQNKSPSSPSESFFIHWVAMGTVEAY